VWHVVALALTVFAAAWLNWRVPLIRFAWLVANLVTFVGAMFLPTVAVVAAFRARPRWLGTTQSAGVVLESACARHTCVAADKAVIEARAARSQWLRALPLNLGVSRTMRHL
jgi:hypothetical protein